MFFKKDTLNNFKVEEENSRFYVYYRRSIFPFWLKAYSYDDNDKKIQLDFETRRDAEVYIDSQIHTKGYEHRNDSIKILLISLFFGSLVISSLILEGGLLR